MTRRSEIADLLAAVAAGTLLSLQRSCSSPGCPNAAKLASPCRLPYGTPVEVPTLRQVDRAETALKRCASGSCGSATSGRSRLELGPDDLTRAATPEGRRALEDAVRAAGYAEVRVEPFESG